MEGGSFDVFGSNWSFFDQWEFNDLQNMDSFSNYVLYMDGQFQNYMQTAANGPGNREYYSIVADGVETLDVIVKGIVQTLKTIPGVPAAEIRRFEILDKTLEKGVVLIKTGGMSDESAKKFVKDGMEIAFGQASDVALSLVVGYLTNHITELLPGWGKAIPFAAIVATYAASKATGQVGEVIADATTEALFAGIDVAKRGMGSWWNSGLDEIPDTSDYTHNLVQRFNGNFDEIGNPLEGYSNGEYFQNRQIWFYELNDMGNPAYSHLDNNLHYSNSHFYTM